MIDRILAGLRNQGPGAIPALVLSLLALTATGYWLLSRDDDEPAQTQGEVVSAPEPLVPASPSGDTAPPAPPASGSGSGGGDDGGGQSAARRDGGGDGSGSPTAVAPTPSGSDGGSDTPSPSGDGGSSNGAGSAGNAPSIEDVEQLLNGNRNPGRHQGSSDTLPGVENLLDNGSDSGSGEQGGSAPPIQDLLEGIKDQK